MTLTVGVLRPDSQSRLLLSARGEPPNLIELAGEREALQWIEDNAAQPIALVLGPDVEKPVQLAARALAINARIDVLICTRPAQHAQREAECRGSPLLGRAVRCLAVDDLDGAASMLADVASRAERRFRHSAVITAAQARLQPPPQSRASRRSHHFIEKLWKHLPLAVIVVDDPEGAVQCSVLDCKILECNDRALALLAQEGEGGPAVGRRLVGCFPEAAREEVAALLSDARSPDPRARSFELGGAGDEARSVEALAVAVHAEDCVLVLIQDVTERRRAEEEQQRQWSLIAHQQAEIEALSTPIIQVWADVLVLPIIGVVDEERAVRMTAELLSAVVHTGARYIIVDLTGAGRMDAAIAERLLRMMSAARLLGTSCLMSGIAPAVARTFVDGGVSLDAIQIFADVHAALRFAFGMGAFAPSR